MPIVRLTLEDGLSSVPGEGGQNTVLEPTVNVYGFQGRVIRRGGHRPIDGIPFSAYPGVTPGGAQWGVNATWPTAGYSTSGFASQSGSNDTLYLAASLGTRQIIFTCGPSVPTTTRYGSPVLYTRTGGAWVETDYAVVGLPLFNQSGSFTTEPFHSHKGGAGIAATVYGTEFMLIPDTSNGWTDAAETRGGITGCWMKLVWPAAAAVASASIAIDDTKVVTDDTPIWHVNAWKDRGGKSHRFLVGKSEGDADILYVLDGALLTQGEDLSMAWTDPSAAPFNNRTLAWSAYHDATDRLIGYVHGRGWFYLIAGNGEIYDFQAGDGVDTPYASAPEGLRSYIPTGSVFALHDGRIFVADGQRLYWSGPLEYADIWPNENELTLSDDAGPITGMASAAGQLIIFKRDATWVLTYSGDGDSYFADKVAGGLGCIAPKSCAVAGSYVYRLTESGPAVFDGQQDYFIDGLVARKFSGKFSARPSDAVGLFHSPTNQYRLFYSTDGDTMNEALYGNIDDPKSPKWWKQGRAKGSTKRGISGLCWMVDKTPESNQMICGDHLGIVWAHDTGDTDAWSDIDCVIRTNDLAAKSSAMRRVRRVTPHVASRNFVSEFQVTFIPDGSARNTKNLTLTDQHSSWKLPVGNSGWGWFGQDVFNNGIEEFVEPAPAQQAREFHLGARCRKFQVELTRETSHPFELVCLELDYNDLGSRNE